MMNDSWGGGGYGWISFVLGLVFLTLIVVGSVFVVRASRGPRETPGIGYPPRVEPPPEAQPKSPALAILEDRYARGEIDREEFLARKKDLTG